MSDLVPVFEIHSSSMIEDSDAEEMESAIVQNQDKMTYWTNFDSWIDYVTLLFWVGGIAMIGMAWLALPTHPPKKRRRLLRFFGRRVKSIVRERVGKPTLDPRLGGRTYRDSNNRDRRDHLFGEQLELQVESPLGRRYGPRSKPSAGTS